MASEIWAEVLLLKDPGGMMLNGLRRPDWYTPGSIHSYDGNSTEEESLAVGTIEDHPTAKGLKIFVVYDSVMHADIRGTRIEVVKEEWRPLDDPSSWGILAILLDDDEDNSPRGI